MKSKWRTSHPNNNKSELVGKCFKCREYNLKTRMRINKGLQTFNNTEWTRYCCCYWFILFTRDLDFDCSIWLFVLDHIFRIREKIKFRWIIYQYVSSICVLNVMFLSLVTAVLSLDWGILTHARNLIPKSYPGYM